MNFPALRTTQKQQHTVTPRLQHAVRLLQLSSLDFAPVSYTHLTLPTN